MARSVGHCCGVCSLGATEPCRPPPPPTAGRKFRATVIRVVRDFQKELVLVLLYLEVVLLTC